MKLRNVQKTGNMFYVYLPTEWCRNKKITSGSRIEVDRNSSGNLVLSTSQKEEPVKDIKLQVDETDLDIISELVISCFINPIKSFEIELKKPIEPKKLLQHTKIVGHAITEVDKFSIYSEPTISVTNSLTLCISNMKKMKGLIKMIMTDPDPVMIKQYTDEIDWNTLMVNKAIISSLLHKRESKRNTVELHYLSMISMYLDRSVEHIISFNDAGNAKEKKFLEDLYHVFDEILEISNLVNERSQEFNHERVFILFRKVKSLKTDDNIFREQLIKHSLTHCAEIFLHWSITFLAETDGIDDKE